MSDLQNKKTEIEVSSLKESLKEMPSDMHFFSLSMRSLYSDKSVGSSSVTARKFTKLRDNTRQDALVYLKCILPISTKFVMSIKEYFEYYEALSYEEWREMLPDIREETQTYKEVAQAVLRMYENIMVTLKKRKDEAKILMTEFTDLQQQFEEQQRILSESAKSKAAWAFALVFVPGVNLIATPLLQAAADEDTVKAVAKQAQAKVHEAATLTVAEVLIPALSRFIEGLTKAAGFFQVMEMELESFEGKAGKNIESPKLLHYKVMSKEAKEIKSLCQSFYAVLPAVRTDFEAIPNEGTDQNYVDKWLKKQLAEIEKKRSKAQKFLLNYFQGSEGKAALKDK